MLSFLVRLLESQFFEVLCVWSMMAFVTFLCRPGTELETWVKARGPRWWWALVIVRKVFVEVPGLVDAVANWVWKRTPEQALRQVAPASPVVNINHFSMPTGFSSRPPPPVETASGTSKDTITITHETRTP